MNLPIFSGTLSEGSEMSFAPCSLVGVLPLLKNQSVISLSLSSSLLSAAISGAPGDEQLLQPFRLIKIERVFVSGEDHNRKIAAEIGELLAVLERRAVLMPTTLVCGEISTAPLRKLPSLSGPYVGRRSS